MLGESKAFSGFSVDDIDAAAAALEERGFAFEVYEGASQDERGIMRDQGPTIAWFRDPDGNVPSIIQLDG